VIFRLEGGVYRFAAGYSLDPVSVEHERQTPISPGPATVVRRAAMTAQVVQIEDAWTDPLYEQKALAKIARSRSMLGVPLMREGKPIGVIGLSRTRVDPFAQREIELVRTFADQAVIAIENARLFEAEQQRTRELVESLEQQTATSEVLQVISSSPGDLEPVFAAMLEKAVRICDATFGNIYRSDGDTLHLVAAHNMPPAFAEFAFAKFRRRSPLRSSPQNAIGRALATKIAVHVADLAAQRPYIEERDAGYVAAVELGGARTFLAAPMLKEDELIGLFSLYRQEVRPFTDKQIALVTNFAAQAVIAIENARLLSELRESLQEQTATAEVLQVISGSPGDLEPVFAAMLEKAVRICDAKFGNISRWDGDALYLLATHNTPLAYAEARRRSPVRPNPNNIFGRMVATKTVVHVPDAAELREQDNPEYVAAVELGGVRTCLAVPMLKEHELVGSISLFRQEVLPFTDKQIALITNFASQAVIAIENARLLKELRERTGGRAKLTSTIRRRRSLF
jgi:GAF domain-containing protein